LPGNPSLPTIAEILRGDLARWGRVVREARAKAD